MEAWWTSLDTSLQVFYGIAITTTVLMVFQLALALLGFGDTDMDVDVADAGDVAHAGDAAHAADAGAHVLSVRTVVAFFTGFGWGGVVGLKSGLTLPGAIAVAVLTGAVLMAAVYFLMRALFSMRYSGTLDYRNAIGVVGDVYLPVPGGMRGPGQVEVLVQGRLAVVRAFTRAPETLPNHAPVRVVGVVDQQTILVEPLEAPGAGTDKET